MATISACTSTTTLSRAALLHKASAVRPSAVLGLPSMTTKKAAKVSCSVEVQPQESGAKLGMGASLLAAACAAAVSSPAAVALVDDRMSTEGTGLPFGLSNNLLGWILFAVFGVIWALYFLYVGGLEEDEESGLSL